MGRKDKKMEIWLLILASLCVTLLLHLLFGNRNSSSPPLPPDPHFFPFLGTIQWLREGLAGFDSYLHSAHHRLGPILTLRITSQPSIFIADRFLAHQALVQNGVVFADRPPLGTINKIVDKHNISSGSYGATWRLLRRNLTSEILNPLRVRSYAHARHWVLEILFERFRNNGDHEKPIVVVDHLHYVMFALLVLMCFGDKLDEKQIKEVEVIQRKQLLSLSKFNVFNIWPKLTKLILRRRWQEFLQIRKEQRDVLVPLIRARIKIVEERKKRSSEIEEDYVQAYVDTLLDLELPEEQKKLNEEDIMNLCSEFLTAGTDTTATALQWIMANLVKYPEIQERLYKEIKQVVGGKSKEIKEEDLQKMPYLKAVVLEALRKHPPGHFVLPHRVTEDTVLGGYKVPKDGTVNFMVVEIGRDPKLWDEPMEFKPERFIGEEEAVDITGSRGIKMMPFGAGRRICPAIGLAILHLEYYVANMVKEFEWKEVEGDEVDFSEKIEFTVVMKHSLKARAVPRTNH